MGSNYNVLTWLFLWILLRNYCIVQSPGSVNPYSYPCHHVWASDLWCRRRNDVTNVMDPLPSPKECHLLLINWNSLQPGPSMTSSTPHSWPLIVKRQNTGSTTQGHLLTLSKTPKNTKSKLLLITVTLDVNNSSNISSNGKDTQMRTTHGSQQIMYTPQCWSRPIIGETHYHPLNKIKEGERNAKSLSAPSNHIFNNTFTPLQHVFVKPAAGRRATGDFSCDLINKRTEGPLRMRVDC